MSSPLLLPAPLIVWFLALAAWVRAGSYWLREPHPTPYAALIEGVISYHSWAWILAVSGLLLVAGLRWPWPGFIGHVVGMWCYLVFSTSVFVAAALEGAPWTGGMALAGLAGLHLARVLQIGQIVGRRNRG